MTDSDLFYIKTTALNAALEVCRNISDYSKLLEEAARIEEYLRKF